MTWETPDGDRKLTGAEAALVGHSLGMMADMLSESFASRDQGLHRWDFGVTLFDELNEPQQLAVIRQVGTHLLEQTPDTLELTAVNEAAAYAIFRNVVKQIEVELDMARLDEADGESLDEDTFWRERTLQACRESGFDEAFRFPESGCNDLSEWVFLVDGLADRILWDRDFEMADSFLDSDPVRAGLLKRTLGIDPDYYSSIPADAAEDDVEQLAAAVRALAPDYPDDREDIPY